MDRDILHHGQTEPGAVAIGPPRTGSALPSPVPDPLFGPVSEPLSVSWPAPGNVPGAGKTGALFAPAALARLMSITAQAAAAARGGIDLVVRVSPGMPTHLVGDSGAIAALLDALALSAVATAAAGPLDLTLSVGLDPDTDTGTVLRAELVGDIAGPDGFGLVLARRLVATSGAGLTVDTAADGTRRIALSVPVGLPARMTDAERLMSWARSRGGRLLVVDDSPTNRMLTAGLLSKVGFSVELATGGAEAVVAVAKSAVPPEAVLMDVAMPDIDGIAATATIRSLSGDRGRIPIIAVTANTQPDDRSRCLAAGMNDYVKKPVRRADLLAALERWLSPPA